MPGGHRAFSDSFRGSDGASLAPSNQRTARHDPRKENEMSTARQKAAARKNVKKAQKASASRRHAGKAPKRGTHPMTSHTEHGVKSSKFAFPKERKEPLTDARHVRNAIARFNQVEGVSKTEKDAAWRRIKAAAKEYGIEVSHRPR
jgi:hypothetical protein